MSENDSGMRLMIIMGIFVFCFFGWLAIDVVFYEPGRIEAIEIQLEYDGISVQEVTINSPTVYFEVDDYDEFKEVLQDQNSSVIFSESMYYYIFNEDYTVAWRMSRNTIYREIETQ